MKAALHTFTTSLLGLSLVAAGLMGCQTDKDPVSKYPEVKAKSVAPHGDHKLPVKIHTVEFDPQHVVVKDFFFVEKDPAFKGFIEGRDSTLTVKATSRLPEELAFDLRVEGLPGEVNLVKSPTEEGQWQITWNPGTGIVPTDELDVQHDFKIIVVPDRANSDPKAIKAVENDDLTYQFSVPIFKDSQAPEIVAIDWEGKDGENDTTIELNEGEIKEFSITVKSPGASEISQPEISPAGWSSILDSEKHRILHGSEFVWPASPKSVEKIAKNTWVFHMAFDTKNRRIAYPAEVRSNKPVESDAANYRVVFSSFHFIDHSGENEALAKAPGQPSFSQAIDFKVKYTGESTRIFFPWDDGRNSLEACPGQTYSYNFIVSSNTGVGRIEVDTAAALAKFKRSPGVGSAMSLTCDAQKFDSSQTTCLFRWGVPQTVRDGSTYDLTLTAGLKMGVEGQARTIVETTSTEGIKINSKNGFCTSASPKAEVKAGAASTANQGTTEATQPKTGAQ